MKKSTESIFEVAGAIAVIPVNCEGVAGKGVALDWRRLDQRAYENYEVACLRKLVTPGSVLPVVGDSYWVLAATKNRWRYASLRPWIDQCLVGIVTFSILNPYTKIAVPLLGAGCGGIDKDWVLSRMEEAFADFDNIIVCVP